MNFLLRLVQDYLKGSMAQTVAKTLQRTLRNGQLIPSDGYIVIGGSFPNGRAKLPGLDIDVVISSPPVDKLMG